MESDSIMKGDWKDISNESKRRYLFPNGVCVTVLRPLKVLPKAPPPGSVGGGSHRVITEDGSVYIPSGWIALAWKGKGGKIVYDF